MGINSALTTALSGLATSQQQIDVVGNNIANVNTIGYKSASVDFKTQFLQNFSYGSAPSTTSGGTNPIQIGLGVQSGAVTTDFSDGTIQTTGVDTDMAIQGSGFFILNQGAAQVYTRDGTFQLNNKDQLVSSTGQIVQGYGVDSNYQLVPGVLGNLTIPVGTGNLAQATTSASFTGNLNSNGTIPTSVSQLASQPLYLSDGSGGIDPTNPPTGSTLLTNVTASSGAADFQLGDVITFSGSVGGANVTNQTLTVTSSTKLSDLESFIGGSLGIDTAAGANGAITTAPGSNLTAITTPTPIANAVQLSIAGNPGTANDITLTANSISISRGTPATTVTPITWTKTSNATGESITTQMNAYDSLGTQIPVNVTAVLSSETSSGSTWQFFATSPMDPATGTAINNLVGSGTLNFDSNGNLLSTNGNTVTINRANTGAVPNLSFTLNFKGLVAQNGTGKLQESNQDGAAPGHLVSFSIGSDGTINGSYSNGLSRTVGQVALATFQNDEGLVNDGSNTYSAGPNSGTAVITAPQQLSAGSITANSLEGSNVDLSTEFVNLISASTAFSASSRVITTSEQLLQALLQAAG